MSSIVLDARSEYVVVVSLSMSWFCINGSQSSICSLLCWNGSEGGGGAWEKGTAQEKGSSISCGSHNPMASQRP